MIRPLGFSTDDRYLKRSGLDYWKDVEIEYYDSFDELQTRYPDANYYYATTKAPLKYTNVNFKDGDFIVFGKETKGLPEELLKRNLDKTIRVPMGHLIRSLNLANSVAIILYEALRQNNFFDLEGESSWLIK